MSQDPSEKKGFQYDHCSVTDLPGGAPVKTCAEDNAETGIAERFERQIADNDAAEARIEKKSAESLRQFVHDGCCAHD